MKAKQLFVSMLSTVLVVSPLACLQGVNATSPLRNQAGATEMKANLIARGGGAAAAGDLAIGAAQLGVQIENLVKASQNRSGFVRGLMQQANYAARGKYNVMVFNMSQDHDFSPRGTQFFKQAVYDGVYYGIWIFEDGTFTNKGDGGYINWAFSGKFQRTGKQGHTVNFQRL